MVTGLKNPESVCVGPGPDRKVYVTIIGEFDKDGDGAVVRHRRAARPSRSSTGLDDPKGIVVVPEVALRHRQDEGPAHRRTARARPRSSPPPTKFPTPPMFLNDIAVDPESGTLYVSDSGDLKGKGGAVYRIDPKGQGHARRRRRRSSPGSTRPTACMNDGTSSPARRRLRHRQPAPREARRRHVREDRRRASTAPTA